MKTKLKSLLLLWLIAATGCSNSKAIAPTQSTGAPGNAADSRPNFIFILTDDMTLSELEFMPKTLELLGSEGATFSNFFVSSPLCCPSRVCILRGQYPHNTQILSNWEPQGGFSKFHRLGLEDSTIATWLQQAGYRTALIGKYLNGYPESVEDTYIPPGWTEWYSPVSKDAVIEYNYTLNENGKLVAYQRDEEDYATDVFTNKAIQFIRQSVEEQTPFFAYVSVFAPHFPSIPAPRHKDLFKNYGPKSMASFLEHIPSFNEEDISDKPQFVQEAPMLADQQITQLEKNFRNRLRSLQAVDEMVANLVDELDSLGQLDNTYIIFTSDNGYHMGQHRLPEGKSLPYEEDIHVPLVIRGPGIKPGTLVNALTVNIDFAPTIAELAGLSAPDFVDGRSFVPLLRGESPDDWRAGFLIERGDPSEEYPSLPAATPSGDLSEFKVPPAFFALRTADYAYVEYSTGEIELYDPRADPYQLQNLAATADPSLLEFLHAWLEALKQCASDSCRVAEETHLSP